MKVVFVSNWLADKMGYAENLLPKAMAGLGIETHLVTSTLQPPLPNYEEAYEPFLGPRIKPAGSYRFHGFTVHRLPHGSQRHGVYIHGLHRKLAELSPDVVQCFTIFSASTYQVALSKPLLGFKLFLEEHIHASVYRPPSSRKRKLFMWAYPHTIGPYLSLVSERCYPIAPDVEQIASRYFGYSPKKMEVMSLGVDTDAFSPVMNEEQSEKRTALRRELGFADEDIVCVYSGRFTSGKQPQVLADAIANLSQTHPHYKGLFIGSGTEEEVRGIEQSANCVVRPFVPYHELADFYRAADIGVWPAQESLSQLDAAACGLPLILSDHIHVLERVDGNGLLYKEGDIGDLRARLLDLNSASVRVEMGRIGMERMLADYSWTSVARRRLRDYRKALGIAANSGS